MLSAIILSAGQAKRMGTLKQLLPWQGSKTVLDTVLANVLSCQEIDGPVHLILGAGAETIRTALAPVYDPRLKVVENFNWQEGMLSSIIAGLNQLPPDCQGFMLILGDQPLVGPTVFQELARRFLVEGPKLLIPTFGGRRGHPVVVARSLIPEILALKGDVGLRELVQRYPEMVLHCELGDRGILIDLDSPEDYARHKPPSAIGPVLIRGAGEMASGIAQRLFRAGFPVVMTELAEPLAVRRTVSFAQAVIDGSHIVEGVEGLRVTDPEQWMEIIQQHKIPILVGEPDTLTLKKIRPFVLVDATLSKRDTGITRSMAQIVIGVGPGYSAGKEVHAVVETQRGHDLGRVYYDGPASPDTGEPGEIGGYTHQRVVRALGAGTFFSERSIGDLVNEGDVIGWVDGQLLTAKISGILRGLIHSGTRVSAGVKVGDIDPRANRAYCYSISEKARAIAGGVLEAILCLSRSSYP